MANGSQGFSGPGMSESAHADLVLGDLLTTAEAASLIGVSPRTLTRYVLRGRAKAVTMRDHLRAPYYFTRAEVERLAGGED